MLPITECTTCVALSLFSCSERKYDKENFEGNVMEFPFDDHMAPPFELIFSFCEDMVTF
jgi:phosphatidylinositol-3,4,5-trisphosphate 3-phosphatase/dual-specificity protein phosphatase PTEN